MDFEAIAATMRVHFCPQCKASFGCEVQDDDCDCEGLDWSADYRKPWCPSCCEQAKCNCHDFGGHRQSCPAFEGPDCTACDLGDCECSACRKCKCADCAEYRTKKKQPESLTQPGLVNFRKLYGGAVNYTREELVDQAQIMEFIQQSFKADLDKYIGRKLDGTD